MRGREFAPRDSAVRRTELQRAAPDGFAEQANVSYRTRTHWFT